MGAQPDASRWQATLRRAVGALRSSESAHRGLRRGAVGTLGLKLLAVSASVISAAILARTLGARDFGVYAYALSWATLLAVFAVAGMDTLLVRNVALYLAQEAHRLAAGLLALTASAIAAFSLVLAAGGATVAWVTGGGEEWAAVFILAMALTPMYALTRLTDGAMRGLHRVVPGQLAEHAVRPLVFIGLLVAGAIALGDHFGPTWAMALHVTAAFIALVGGLVMLRRSLPVAIRGVKRQYDSRVWLASAAPLLLIGGMRVLNHEADQIMLGLLREPESVGVYRIAVRGSEFVGFGLLAVNTSLAPAIARATAGSDRIALQRLVTYAAQLTLLVSVPIGLGLVVFGDWFLAIFGAEFANGRPALTILAVAQLLTAIAGPVGVILVMTGHERDAAWGLLLAVVVNLSLNFALIPALDTVGAALATAVSLVVWNLLLAVVVYRRLGIVPTGFWKPRADTHSGPQQRR